MDAERKDREKRVTLDRLLRSPPRPVDQVAFHAFLKNIVFRVNLYNAFCALINDNEGKQALEAFRSVVEKRLGQPWQPEYHGGIEMALIASIARYSGDDKREHYKDSAFPKTALDDQFIERMKRGFNQICNSFAVYSLAITEHTDFVGHIKAAGGMDGITQQELMKLLERGFGQYAQRNLYG